MLKRSKIVATVGPASQDPKILEQLVRAGVDVFRLNFSHGDRESHLEIINHIKRIRKKLHQPVAILQDLAGPKIRLGKIEHEPLSVKVGDSLVIDASPESAGNGNRVGINHPHFAKDVFPGARLLLADGDLELQVTKVEDPLVHCRVVIGGEIYSHKGVNFPTGSFDVPAITEKDRGDLTFGLEHHVDMIAVSFVRSAADIETARELCREKDARIPIIAKIEKHEAVRNLDEIIEAADGVMVARGDLGVEIDIQQVPIVQKRIISRANQAGKPVITATQMLRSMVDSQRPTRAEVTDVANAILDGSDAIMLSEESAVGKFPVKAVSTMAGIALEAEKYYLENYHLKTEKPRTGQSRLTESVAHSAVVLAQDIDAKLIFAMTRSGYTARAISRFRPCSFVLALTPNEDVYRQLSISWGVIPVIYPLQREMQSTFSDAIAIARESKILAKGDRYVFTSGFPLGEPGSINQVMAGEIDG